MFCLNCVPNHFGFCDGLQIVRMSTALVYCSRSYSMSYSQGRMTPNQYDDNIILFNLSDGSIKHQIKLFIMSKECEAWRKSNWLDTSFSVFHCFDRPSWLEMILWVISEVPSSAGWELCKCGQGSTGQCTPYTLCNTRLTMERREMTVGNDFCTFLFAELHGALNFHTIHSFLKEKEVWFETWYTCWIVLQNECTRPDFFSMPFPDLFLLVVDICHQRTLPFVDWTNTSLGSH